MSDKRRPFMTDDERAEISRDHRLRQRPDRPGSEPGDAFELDDSQLTPITSVMERIEADLGDELTERERLIIKALGRHDANQEMRSRRRSDSSDNGILGRRLDAVEDTLVEKFGKSGRNGDVGTLKDRIDKAESRRWWAITFLAGLLVTVIGSAIAFGSWMGSIESDVETLKARAMRRNFSQPEYPATKESAP